MDEGVFIPMVLFVCIVAALGLALYFRNEKAKIVSGGGAEYRQLAEEAVRGQRVLLEEVKAMNASLREIEKLLREV